MSEPGVFFYGSTRPLPRQVHLRAGPLSLVFEEGDLRYIKLGDREIVRRIYAAVRDHNWGTIPPVLTNLQIHSDDTRFEISYDVENIQPDLGIDFAWKGTISGNEQGTITFRMDGEARSTFRKNRIGFCVLHPIKECAGTPVIVEQADGSQLRSEFPVYITPRQPFVNMRAISHQVTPDLWAEVRFEGDLFEVEDQRAWTDASFKTYCTPLSLPFPAEIVQGTHVSQSVTLTLRGQIAAPAPVSISSEPTPVMISLEANPPVALPRLGLASASHGQPLTELEVKRLRALSLSHLRADLYPSRPDFAARLRQSADESQRLGIPLEAAVFLSDNAEAELKTLRTLLDAKIGTWLILPVGLKTTTEGLIRLARQHLSSYDPAAQIGGGTNVYCAELNRDRPTPDTLQLLDFVNYSANPQVHAFDNASLAETCAALASTVQSIEYFTGNKPLHVSPITLRPRFNAVATGPEAEPLPGELPWQVDPRQLSLFGAAWTLCSLKYLAESGRVERVTYCETTGWRGVMETAQGSPIPERFPSIPGSVFPLYHVLADLADFVGGEVLAITSSAPLRVDGLLVRKNGKARLLLANWTDEEQAVYLSFGQGYTLRLLDGSNVEQAMITPVLFRAQPAKPGSADVVLPPFAIARIELDQL